jgi:hypothetical protein
MRINAKARTENSRDLSKTLGNCFSLLSNLLMSGASIQEGGIIMRAICVFLVIAATAACSGSAGSVGPAGPAGPAGQTGLTGPAGPTGPAGKDGAPGKDAPKGFVASANFQNLDAAISNACANYGKALLQVTAPVQGTFVVEGTAIVKFNRSTADTIFKNSPYQTVAFVFVGKTDSECPGTFGHDAFLKLTSLVPAAPGTSADGTPDDNYYFPIPFRRVVHVAAGATTFFVNSQSFPGSACAAASRCQAMEHVGIDAIFIPD